MLFNVSITCFCGYSLFNRVCFRGKMLPSNQLSSYGLYNVTSCVCLIWFDLDQPCSSLSGNCLCFCHLRAWLTFTEGKSVKEMVDQALQHVPNSDGQFSINVWFNGDICTFHKYVSKKFGLKVLIFIAGDKYIDQVCSFSLS